MLQLFRALLIALASIAGAWAMPGVAQTTSTFTNSSQGSINGSTTCAEPLVRNFMVSSSFTVADVNIGVYATHTWRGDLRITLQAPDGTRVRLVNGDTNNTRGDNFNVLLDDAGTQTVNTDSATGNHAATMPPPFENTFVPNSALSAFNGKAASGTWRLEICDLFPSEDNGTFRYAALYLTAPPTNFADLSLTKTVSNSAPTFGQQLTYTLTIANSSSSTQSATPTIRDILPTGATYVSHSGTGSYNSGTAIWSPGTIPAGQSRQLQITVIADASSGATIANTAEILTSNRADSDSTPGNGVPSEDDYASAFFTVAGTRVAGVPPSLTCPAGFLSFDWTGRSWPQGSTANNYQLGNMAFNWSISSPAGFMDIASLGGQHPVLTTAAQNQTTLSKAIDFTNRTEAALTTISLGEVVDGAQFTIFDVDFATNDFADRVRLWGTMNGGPDVIPVLTNGVANYVIGNQAFGDAPSAADSADGNVVATFDDPVDTIYIEYGNHSGAPANPDGQAIQMQGGIVVCDPTTSLIVVKSSTPVSNPNNGTTDPKNIPGATVRYCILINNTGNAAARDISASDALPPDITFVAGSIRSGTTCNAATVEDDDAVGADESDPAGASFAAGTLSYSRTELLGGNRAAFTFDVVID